MGIGHWAKKFRVLSKKARFPTQHLKLPHLPLLPLPPLPPLLPHSLIPSFPYLTELLLLLSGLGKAVEFLTFLSAIKMS